MTTNEETVVTPITDDPNPDQLKSALKLIEAFCKSTDRFFDSSMWTRFLQKKDRFAESESSEFPYSSWTSILFEEEEAYAIGSFTIQKTFYTENLSVDVLYVSPEKRRQGVARSLLKMGCMWGVQQKGVSKKTLELPPKINPGVMSLLNEFGFVW